MYYAVHKGRQPGIYSTWSECQNQVKDFKNSVFKKFKTEQKAQQFVDKGWASIKKKKYTLDSWVKPTKKPAKTNSSVMKMNLATKTNARVIEVYTDGSADNVVKCSYYGIGIVFPDENRSDISQRIQDKSATNNRAELMAILCAVKAVLPELQAQMTLHIYSDSQYSIKSIDGTYKNGTMNLDLIETARDLYRQYNIKFFHVRAHKGNKYNEMADKLARKGFGL